MPMHRLFNATWDQAHKDAVGYDDSDILTGQRVIIVNGSVKWLIRGQPTMMFDENGVMCLITNRYRIPWLSLTVYLHALEQTKWLHDTDVVYNVTSKEGLVTYTHLCVG